MELNSSLDNVSSYFNENTFPFYLFFIITPIFLLKIKSDGQYLDLYSSLIQKLCKVSVILSFLIFLSSQGVSGRDETLEAISGNIYVYYLSFINTAIIMIVIASFFSPKVLSIDKKTSNLIIIMVAVSTLMSFSRSIAFFFLTAYLLSGIKFDINLKKIFFLLIPSVALVLVMPVLQGRTDDVNFAIIRTFQNLIFYNSYPFYLGQDLLSKSEIYYGISFGLPGYLISKLFGLGLMSNSFFDNKMMYDFVNLGQSALYGEINANVTYPTWAVVAVDYGEFSFLIYLLVTLLVAFLSFKNLFILASWIYYRFYLVGLMVAPMILRDALFEFVFVLMIELYLFSRTRGVRYK